MSPKDKQIIFVCKQNKKDTMINFKLGKEIRKDERGIFVL